MAIKQMAAASLVALCAFATPAHAGLYDLGELNATTYSADFSNKVYGGFTDTYSFTLVQDSVVGASVTNVSLYGVNDITNFSASLDSQALKYTVTDEGVVVVDLLYGTAPAGPGSHSLTVSGVAPTTGATYGGNITAAVPEAETYAMLLAGLGVIGFIGRRRRAH